MFDQPILLNKLRAPISVFLVKQSLLNIPCLEVYKFVHLSTRKLERVYSSLSLLCLIIKAAAMAVIRASPAPM